MEINFLSDKEKESFNCDWNEAYVLQLRIKHCSQKLMLVGSKCIPLSSRLLSLPELSSKKDSLWEVPSYFPRVLEWKA